MAFYPTDFTAKISNFAAKSLGVLVVIITDFPFLLPYVALVVRDSGGGKTTRPFPTPTSGGETSGEDFRRRQPERGPGRDGRDGASRPRDRLGRHLDVGGAGLELGRAVTRRSGLQKTSGSGAGAWKQRQ